MHGNVVQLTDEKGTVIKTYEYDSFGNELKPDKNDYNPFRYCGEYYDKETEEIYLRARYYKPSLGRFITRDSYTGEEDKPLSLHLYTYCQNDGVNSVDPSGHDSYIIYDRNAIAGDQEHYFRDEAHIVQKQLRKKYRKPCHLMVAGNAKDFSTLWKNVGKRLNFRKRKVEKVRVDEVYIISHGSIAGSIEEATGYMYFEDHRYHNKKSKIISRKEKSSNKEIYYNNKRDFEVSKLQRKRIHKITFSCCNTANPDCYNIADAFIKRMNVKEVDGFDGGAYFDYSDKKLKKGMGFQTTWGNYAQKIKLPYAKTVGGGAAEVGYYKRERMGLRKYRNGKWSPIKYNKLPF